MDAVSDLFMDLIAREDNPLGLLLIAFSALLEYVFPPFPGDTITLFAAVLITAYGWNFGAVFGAVMVGSLVGSMAAFYLGDWLGHRREQRAAQAAAGPTSPADPASASTRRALLDRLVAGFERHGAAYLIVNRFLPGVRALFFVAAGMARMRPRAVLFYSAVSAAAWNLALIAAGSLLGANFDTLARWVRRYTTVVWLLLGALALVLLVRWLLRRAGRPE